MVARRKSSRTAGSDDVMKADILSLLGAAAAAAVAVLGVLPRTRRLMEPTRRRHSWGSCDVAVM